MQKPITVAIAGLGGRGKDTYAPMALSRPDLMKIVAIADIVPEKVADVAQTYGVPPEGCFSSAEEMLAQPRLADVLFVCTQDRQHVGHAIPALEKGYHILMEKPISPVLSECQRVLQAAKKAQRQVVVCHVLRYTPFFQKIKEVIDSGRIGRVVSVQSLENVVYWHQAHSFVRGNWRREEDTSPMILQKSCHDLDILLWLLGERCARVSSFGSLSHFREENAPAHSAARCRDCQAREGCPYDAYKIYLTDEETGVLRGHTGWPADIVCMHPTEAGIRAALEDGPYGRCVYRCDNDVVDHQVVNMELEHGQTIGFTMCAFTKTGGRTLKIMGTHGDIRADMHENFIDVEVYGGETEHIDVRTLAADLSGHAGGDIRMVEEFLEMLAAGGQPSGTLSTLEASIESHLAALAAEHSRKHGGASVEIAPMRGL